MSCLRPFGRWPFCRNRVAPYSHPGGGDVILRNSVRLAEVWMDDFKELFYKRQPHAKDIDFGDVQDRANLRNQLQCKPFQWQVIHVVVSIEKFK